MKRKFTFVIVLFILLAGCSNPNKIVLEQLKSNVDQIETSASYLYQQTHDILLEIADIEKGGQSTTEKSVNTTYKYGESINKLITLVESYENFIELLDTQQTILSTYEGKSEEILNIRSSLDGLQELYIELRDLLVIVLNDTTALKTLLMEEADYIYKYEQHMSKASVGSDGVYYFNSSSDVNEANRLQEEANARIGLLNEKTKTLRHSLMAPSMRNIEIEYSYKRYVSLLNEKKK